MTKPIFSRPAASAPNAFGETGSGTKMQTTPMAVCRDVVSGIVGVYVFIILTVFPLFATDMYFNILVDKYYFFWISTAVMTGMCALIGLIGVFVDYKENKGRTVKAFFAEFSLKEGRLRAGLKKYVRASDWFLIAFMAVAALSAACSEWQYEAFWGNMGRYQGFFLWIWYGALYFMVTRFFRFRKIYLDAALCVGLYMAVWGIQDYLGMDPHGWIALIEDKQKGMFSSSIGNINTYTAVIGLYMALSSVLFVGEGRKTPSEGAVPRFLPLLRSLFYAVCTVVFFAAIIMGRSDNAVLGVGVVLCFLPFYAWKDARGFVRYLLVLSGFFLALYLSGSLTLRYPNPYAGFWSGMLLSLSEKSFILPACAAFLGLAAAFCALFFALFLLRRKKVGSGASDFMRNGGGASGGTECAAPGFLDMRLPKALRIIWLMLGILAALALCWLFWDANHGGHPEWYAPYANAFYFNNDWGTHRGYNWSILIRHFKEFPLWQKLIGSGPETYGIVTRIYDHSAMLNMYGEIYDSPHNEFLQYLFTTGLLGFLSYYGFIIACCLRALGFSGYQKKDGGKKSDAGKMSARRQGADTAYFRTENSAAAGVYAAAAYAAMSFINISVPIVVPLMMLFLYIGIAERRA